VSLPKNTRCGIGLRVGTRRNCESHKFKDWIGAGKPLTLQMANVTLNRLFAMSWSQSRVWL
jgi:hypothetical protein